MLRNTLVTLMNSARLVALLGTLCLLGGDFQARLPAQAAQTSATVTSQSPLPAGYVIGVQDLLGIVFWREQEKALTTDVVVRPDGKISVPMLNDIQAAGLTPEQLASAVQQAAAKFIRDPATTV